MTNITAYHTDDTSTVALAEGAILKDFRGNEHIFIKATRGPQPGKSAKVVTINPAGIKQEYYSTIFPGLEVIA